MSSADVPYIMEVDLLSISAEIVITSPESDSNRLDRCTNVNAIICNTIK